MVILHVDEVILQGFENGDRAAMADQFGAELSRLLTEAVSREIVAGGGMETASVSTSDLPATLGPAFGSGLAAAVFQSIGGDRQEGM